MKKLALSRNIKWINDLLKDQLIIFGLGLLLFMSILIVFIGVLDNSVLVKQKKRFTATEKSREKLYHDSGKHNKYLLDGFRVLYVPPPVNLLIGVSNPNLALRVSLGKEPIWDQLESAFIIIGGNRGFPLSIVFILGGALLMNCLGILSYNRVHRLRARFGKAIFRMIFMDLCIGLLLVFIYYIARLVGLEIPSADGILLMYFGLYSLVLLNLFFVIGFSLSLCLKDQKNAILSGCIFCFVIIFLAPQLILEGIYKNFFNTSNKSFESMEIERFGDNFKNTVTTDTLEKKNNKGRKFEKPLVREWRENIKRQKKIVKRIRKEYYSYEKQVVLLPPIFWVYLASEMTGNAGTGYLNFLECGLQLKEDSIKDYQWEDKDEFISNETFESLEKGNQFIYKDRTHMPDSFCKANFITISYTILLFLISLLIALRQKRLRAIKIKKDKGAWVKNAKNYFFTILTYSSTGLYIARKRDPADVDREKVVGILGMEMKYLTAQCRELKVKDFWSFYSATPDKMAELFNSRPEYWKGGEEPPTADELWPEQWFSPAEGLVTVRALIEFVKSDRCDLKFKDWMLESLTEMERILSEADAHGDLWHLEVDPPRST